MKFLSIVEQSGRTATGIPVPEEVIESVGAGRKRFPVEVTIGGHTYRSTVGPYGGKYMLPLSAEHRGKAGVAAGDEVEVDLVADTAPREVVVPADLAAAARESRSLGGPHHLRGPLLQPPERVRDLDRGGQEGRDP